MYDTTRFPDDQQRGRIWSISGRTRPHEGSKGWKFDRALRFIGDNKSDQQWIRVHKWKNEEVPRRSKKSNRQPRSQCWPPCQSSLYGIYDSLRTGIIFCLNLLTYRWQSKYAGSKFRQELDCALDSITEVRHSTRQERCFLGRWKSKPHDLYWSGMSYTKEGSLDRTWGVWATTKQTTWWKKFTRVSMEITQGHSR